MADKAKIQWCGSNWVVSCGNRRIAVNGRLPLGDAVKWALALRQLQLRKN